MVSEKLLRVDIPTGPGEHALVDVMQQPGRIPWAAVGDRRRVVKPANEDGDCCFAFCDLRCGPNKKKRRHAKEGEDIMSGV